MTVAVVGNGSVFFGGMGAAVSLWLRCEVSISAGVFTARFTGETLRIGGIRASCDQAEAVRVRSHIGTEYGNREQLDEVLALWGRWDSTGRQDRLDVPPEVVERLSTLFDFPTETASSDESPAHPHHGDSHVATDAETEEMAFAPGWEKEHATDYSGYLDFLSEASAEYWDEAPLTLMQDIVTSKDEAWRLIPTEMEGIFEERLGVPFGCCPSQVTSIDPEVGVEWCEMCRKEWVAHTSSGHRPERERVRKTRNG